VPAPTHVLQAGPASNGADPLPSSGTSVTGPAVAIRSTRPRTHHGHDPQSRTRRHPPNQPGYSCNPRPPARSTPEVPYMSPGDQGRLSGRERSSAAMRARAPRSPNSITIRPRDRAACTRTRVSSRSASSFVMLSRSASGPLRRRTRVRFGRSSSQPGRLPTAISSSVARTDNLRRRSEPPAAPPRSGAGPRPVRGHARRTAPGSHPPLDLSR